MFHARLTIAVLALIALPTTALGDEVSILKPNDWIRWDLPTSSLDNTLVVDASYSVVNSDCEGTPYIACTILKRTQRGNWEVYGQMTDTSCSIVIPFGRGPYRLKVENMSTCTLSVSVGIHQL